MVIGKTLRFGGGPAAIVAILTLAIGLVAAAAEPLAKSSPAAQLGGFVLSKPPVPAPTTPFISAEGESIKLGDYGDRLLLLNFWATWCAPCVRELPALAALRAAVPDPRLEILLISLDRHGEPARHARFLDGLGVANLASASDPRGDLLRAFKAPGIPVSVLIGRDGRVIGRVIGEAAWDSPEAEALLRHYLGPG